ncbi:MAG: N-acetyltransferase [Chloroflexota bacterium]
MALEIERVETKKQLQEFIRVPWAVYQNDRRWVPWLYFERLEFFDKTKNPFFEHAEADYFIARRDGRPIGSIAAILNHRHNEFHQENVAHFGVFELLNDAEAGAALLDTACTWARAKGVDRILGPMNLCTNDECGTLIEGFDSPPVILMTYNPPYYIDILEAAGFTKAMDLLAWNNDIANTVTNMPEKVVRVIHKVKDRYKLHIRPVNMKEWDAEIERVEKIYNSAWERNWGFVPMTDKEIKRLADSLKPVIEPRLAFIVEKEGEAVGFSLSVPDVNQVLNRLRPGATVLGSYLGAVRMLLNKRKTDRIRVIALGVIESYRGQGIDALMYYHTAKAAHDLGYRWAEASWILETNDKMNRPIALLGSEVYKKYRIYEKELRNA